MRLLPDLPDSKKRRHTLLAAILILSATLVTACAPVQSMPAVMAQATDNDAEAPHEMVVDGKVVDHAAMHAQMIAESTELPAETLPATPLTMPDNDAEAPHEMVVNGKVVDHEATHAQMIEESTELPAATPLTMPGNDAFGAIQELTAMLLADPETDWRRVDLEALRVHLADMENMTLRVDLIEQSATPAGVRVVIEPQDERALASLRRVLAVHPAQLAAETGWTMSVLEENGRFILTIETDLPNEIEMIRGLGYIGAMAIGDHHKIHHRMIATGTNPHE